MSKKIVFLTLTLLFLFPVEGLFSKGKVVDQVVWIVGSEPILLSEIQTEIIRRKYESKTTSAEDLCLIPEQIALQKLLITQAKLDSLTVSETVVNQQVDTRLKYFIQQIGSKEKLEEYFNKSYTKIKEDMYNTVHDQLLAQQMQQAITNGVQITPADVKRFFSELPKDSIPTIPETVEVQIISISPEVTPAEEERIKSQLRDFREKIESGSYQFSTLAILYSQDRGSALLGGELGFMTKGKLVPEFADVAFSLYDKNKVSRIVETEFGFHIIQLIERKNDQVNCRHILLIPEVSLKDKQNAMTLLDSLATEIRLGNTTFEACVAQYSESKDATQGTGILINPNTGSTKFQLQNLSAEIAKEVYNMQVGEISKAFTYKDEQGKEKIAIIKLRSKEKAHRANFEQDYPTLKQIVQSRKNQELMEKWIEEKQKETYIYMDSSYFDCEFKYPNWIKH